MGQEQRDDSKDKFSLADAGRLPDRLERFLRRYGTTIAVLGVGVTLAAWLWPRNPDSQPPPASPAPASTRFAAAGPNESLIIVAKFRNRSEGKHQGLVPESYIYDSLTQQIRRDGWTDIRAEVIEDVEISNADEARKLGEQYQATLVIWGWYDGLKTHPRVESMLASTAPIQTQETAISLADPSRIETAIDVEQPAQVKYLTFLFIGVTNQDSGQVDRAIKALDSAISSAETVDGRELDRSEAFFWRAIIYQSLQQHDKAITDYAQVIKLRPGDFGAHYNRGIAHFSTGHFDEAIVDYEQAIKAIKPDSVYYAYAYYNRGLAYASIRKFDLAIEDFEEAIKNNPNYANAYNYLGQVYGDQGDYDKAIEFIDKAIGLQPEYAEAFNSRGMNRGRKGDFDGAISDLSRAIELKKDYADAHFNRALAYAGKHDYGAAIDDYTQVIAIHPGDAEVYYRRGQTHEKLGEKSSAIDDFRACVSQARETQLQEQCRESLKRLGVET